MGYKTGLQATAVVALILSLLGAIRAATTDEPRIQPLAFPPSVSLGQEVSVTCVAALGKKPFRFAWKQDGEVLENTKRKHSRAVVDNVVMMTIERVTAEDVGNYTCTVNNGFGSDSTTAALIVEGRRICFQVKLWGFTCRHHDLIMRHAVEFNGR
ncbi:Down syndrome cell adhesion molecule-like protein 1 homolog [Dermacentor silvarum]|uniref:Down syndrome cell adhesion molecule-like protein 1 homolog n=1 Tax=Dermacentor silvarum TaxID=543639 RepID=UPI0021015D6A|nr:Down syndrome cell adhesion molecule-like protein 1 homolog [Dermacentor silvarum]